MKKKSIKSANQHHQTIPPYETVYLTHQIAHLYTCLLHPVHQMDHFVNRRSYLVRKMLRLVRKVSHPVCHPFQILSSLSTDVCQKNNQMNACLKQRKHLLRIVLFFSIAFSGSRAYAQISPPGLGDAQDASWLALGFRQQLSEKASLVSYVGMGRISNPTQDLDAFHKSAIWVINQEFYYQLNPQLKVSGALSYRRQNRYQEQPNYGPASTPLQQEFRLYARISRSFSLGKNHLSGTFRQEMRRFYAPNFHRMQEPLQFRTRLKAQFSHPLGSPNQQLILGAEALLTVSKKTSEEKWTSFQYKESRFTIYYSVKPKKSPFTMDIGYMNNLLGWGKKIRDVHYLALDLIWENPFGYRKH